MKAITAQALFTAHPPPWNFLKKRKGEAHLIQQLRVDHALTLLSREAISLSLTPGEGRVAAEGNLRKDGIEKQQSF